MAPENLLSFSVASVVENVLQHHGARPRAIDMASRLSEEAAFRRYEASTWLKKTLRGVGDKDLPEKPTEEEFLLALRSGIILCNALNNVDPGSVPKVVEIPANPSLLPDGTALTAYQYFENIRNFLVVVQDKGLPTFEASDLEQGGKCGRVVNCVLALKSYAEWKQMGGTGAWKYGGNLKTAGSGNYYIRKNSELFINSFSRNICSNGKANDDQNFSSGFNDEPIELTTSHSLNMLVKAVLSEKKPEEIPSVVESMLKKVVEEFERRMISQNEMENSNPKDFNGDGSRLISKRRVLAELTISSDSTKTEMENCVQDTKGNSKQSQAKHSCIFVQQQKDIQNLKNIIRSTRAGLQTLQTNYLQDMTTLGKHITVLSDASARYQTVLEENRRLYNELQDLKGNIRVYCRVRPSLPGERKSSGVISLTDEGNITVTNILKSGKEERKSFTFNKVFGPSTSQGEVYLDTQPLIRSVLDGFNVCIFAYGQTGSGKTYTMMGPKEIKEESRGVNYRALSDLFQLSEKRKETTAYEISVQMIEIYNEQVRDLLTSDGLVKKLEIRNGSQKGGGLIVPNANLVPVSSTVEIIELMSLGQRNRAVSATAMNDRSSRSHSCLTVYVQGRELTSGAVLRGCMHLVDLAGSERVQKSDVTGERMKEAQHINKSLSALGDVIAALAQKNGHIPYRNSKLTQLLQDSLGGQAKTLMFVHVSPDEDTVGETISTLKFAERVSSVELGAARVNKETQEVKDLREQVTRLKAALARKESEPEDPKSTPTPHRPHQSTPSTKPTSWRERNNTQLSRHKGQGFDLQEQLMAAVDFTDDNRSEASCADEENETDSGEWVDKAVVNKLTSFGSGSSLGEEPSTPLTLRRTNSAESLDSDCSEWDPVLPSASKTRKSQQRRTPSQSPCPPPLRKIPSGPIRATGRPKRAP